MEPARALFQKKSDSLHRLERDKDLWIASTNLKGDPYLVPLSFWWNGISLFISTVLKNPTAKNIVATGKARVALGHTRDVILLDVYVTLLESNKTKECGDEFTKKCGWDPRKANGYRFFRLEPYHIEAWREENEHSERVLMKKGKWLA